MRINQGQHVLREQKGLSFWQKCVLLGLFTVVLLLGMALLFLIGEPQVASAWSNPFAPANSCQVPHPPAPCR